jgi:hypothetical protein
MFSTSITRVFGLTTPIVNAGMAMIARPALAAAVCEAGGLGTIGSDINPPDILRDLVRQTGALTKRPFGVDLIGNFVTDEHVSVLIEEQVAIAIFFWTLPTRVHIERLKQAGVKVWMQVSRVAEAEQAAARCRRTHCPGCRGRRAQSSRGVHYDALSTHPQAFPRPTLAGAGGSSRAAMLTPSPIRSPSLSSTTSKHTKTIPSHLQPPYKMSAPVNVHQIQEPLLNLSSCFCLFTVDFRCELDDRTHLLVP